MLAPVALRYLFFRVAFTLELRQRSCVVLGTAVVFEYDSSGTLKSNCSVTDYNRARAINRALELIMQVQVILAHSTWAFTVASER